MPRLLWLTLARALCGCPADEPPPPPPPKPTPIRPEEQPRFCVFELEGADFDGAELALVPSDRADHGFWLYDAERDQTRLGWVGTWKTWEVRMTLAVPGAKRLGSFSLGEDEPGRGYHPACELSFHDPDVPRGERPLLYLTKGSLTLTDLTGPTLEGTLSGTWASRRGAGDTAPVTSWERVELRDGHFKATFDGSQQGAQRWPGSE